MTVPPPPRIYDSPYRNGNPEAASPSTKSPEQTGQPTLVTVTALVRRSLRAAS
jgi:hypothetical protein